MKQQTGKRCLGAMIAALMLCNTGTAFADADVNAAMQATERHLYAVPEAGALDGWLSTISDYAVSGTELESSYAIAKNMPQMESGAAAVTGTGNGKLFRIYRQPSTEIKLQESNDIYYISWNQYLSPSDQPHTAYTPNRGPQIRLFQKGEINQGQYIYAGLFNAASPAGVFVPGIEARNDSSKSNVTGEKALETGKWYHCDLIINVNVDSGKDRLTLRVYEYGGDGGDAQEITVESPNSGSYPYLMLYTYDLKSTAAETDFHGFSDLKITTYSTEKNAERIAAVGNLISAANSFNPVFGGTYIGSSTVPSSFAVTGLSDIPADLPEGIQKIKWSSTNESVISIDECGMPSAVVIPENDTTLCLTAALTDISGYTFDKSFPITVPSTSSTFTAAGENMINNEYGAFEAISKGADATRTLNTPIDLDSGATYYIKWRSMLNSEGKYLYEKIIFDGAISGVNSSEMSVTTMVSGTSDYGQLVLKTPKSGVETGYRFTSADRLQFKRYYDYVLRIDTAEKDSDDKISLKVYPAGMADKSIWQLKNQPIQLNGIIETLTLSVTSDNPSYVSGITVDKITGADAAKYENAELELAAAESDADVQNVLLNAPALGGAWSSSLVDMAAAKKAFVIDLIEFSQNGIARAALAKDPTGTTAAVTVRNNLNEARRCRVIAAAYNKNGTLGNVSISEAEGLAANTASEFIFDTIGATEETAMIKLFFFDTVQDIAPLREAVSIDGNILVCR